MKKSVLVIIALLLQSVFVFCQSVQKDFPVLKGPYLGQKTPGMTPELFAPGIISTGANEMNICFSPDGDAVFYFITGPSFRPRIILTSFIENSVWTKPMELPFFDIDRTDSYPFMTPDGKKLFFNSSRPYEGMDNSKGPRHHEIWFAEKDNTSWGRPQKIDFGGKYKGLGTFPSVASNGNIYFNQSFDRAGSDIYYSKYENGNYSMPQRLSDEVNGDAKARSFHPYIAPDESYLLFDSIREEDSFGQQDIYISFRDKDGKWSKAQNIGKTINSPNSELRPFVTFDGKYLFFISGRVNIPVLSKNQMNNYDVDNLINSPGNGLQDVYWVDAKIIDELKKKVNNQ